MPVDYERTENLAIIRLNDPATLNALSVPIVESLQEHFRRAALEARAVLLCGAGRAFCSGWNLTTTEPDESGLKFDPGLVLERRVNPLMQALRNLPIPWVSAVQGASAGAGASLALAADVIVAADNAYFLQAFRRIGLVPDAGATWLLARAVGRVRAMELMLLGEKLPAPKALEWGLITRCVPEAALQDTALTVARDLAAGPTRALGMTRRAAWAAVERDFATVLETERTLQTAAGETADFVEGVQAFLQKRPAKFTGG